jgi:hypothetical protein
MLTLKVTYPNAPSTDNGISSFSSLNPTGSLLHLRHLGLDLSVSTPGQWKALRYIIGGPVDGEITTQIWVGESPMIEPRPPLSQVSMVAPLTSCSVSVVTSRDTAGDEGTSTTVDGVPCSELQVILGELEIDRRQSVWIKVEDTYTNTTLIQAPPLDD